MKIQRGDVLWMDLQNPPGGNVRDQSGSRLAIVISCDDEDSTNPMISVVPLTSVLESEQFPFTLLVNPSEQNGLTSIFIAMTFQIQSLGKNRILRQAGHLESHYLIQLDQLLRKLLQL
jgi:mRNA interferase MazF